MSILCKISSMYFIINKGTKYNPNDIRVNINIFIYVLIVTYMLTNIEYYA